MSNAYLLDQRGTSHKRIAQGHLTLLAECDSLVQDPLCEREYSCQTEKCL